MVTQRFDELKKQIIEQKNKTIGEVAADVTMLDDYIKRTQGIKDETGMLINFHQIVDLERTIREDVTEGLSAKAYNYLQYEKTPLSSDDIQKVCGSLAVCLK